MARHPDRHGFTLVEAIIVVVVIVVILAVTIPWMRERERARLQALADTEPWEVFEYEVSAEPSQGPKGSWDRVIQTYKFTNLTEHALFLPPDGVLTIKLKYAGCFHSDGLSRPSSLGEIPPGESIEFSLTVSSCPSYQGKHPGEIEIGLVARSDPRRDLEETMALQQRTLDELSETITELRKQYEEESDSMAAAQKRELKEEIDTLYAKYQADMQTAQKMLVDHQNLLAASLGKPRSSSTATRVSPESIRRDGNDAKANEAAKR